VVLGRLTVRAYGVPWAAAGVGQHAALGDHHAGDRCGDTALGAGRGHAARNSAGVVPAAAMRVEPGSRYANRQAPTRGGPSAGSSFQPGCASLEEPVPNRKRTLLTALGLVLTVSTLVTVRGAISSIQHILDKQFHQVVTWDVAAYLPSPEGSAFLGQVRGMDGVTRAEPAIDSPARLRASGRSIDVDLQALGAATEMHGLFPAGGRQGPPTAGGMLVNRSLTRQVPLRSGSA